MGPSLRLEGVPEHTALSDVVILQQHCGGNTVCVFKGRVKAQGGFVCVFKGRVKAQGGFVLQE